MLSLFLKGEWKKQKQNLRKTDYILYGKWKLKNKMIKKKKQTKKYN